MVDLRSMPDVVVVDEQVHFSFEELCRACATDPSTFEALVEEGLLQHTGSRPDDWRFPGDVLTRALTAARLSRDLHLSADAVVLVVNLLEEIDGLRARLRRAQLA